MPPSFEDVPPYTGRSIEELMALVERVAPQEDANHRILREQLDNWLQGRVGCFE